MKLHLLYSLSLFVRSRSLTVAILRGTIMMEHYHEQKQANFDWSVHMVASVIPKAELRIDFFRRQ